MSLFYENQLLEYRDTCGDRGEREIGERQEIYRDRGEREREKHNTKPNLHPTWLGCLATSSVR